MGKINIPIIILGRINSLEWNPGGFSDSLDIQKYTTGSNCHEELVTAAQDCLVKFHNLSEPLNNKSGGLQPYNIMRNMPANSSYLRTVVPVWKAR